MYDIRCFLHERNEKSNFVFEFIDYTLVVHVYLGTPTKSGT